LDREKIITIAIVIGIFGGLVGGPILSLLTIMLLQKRGFGHLSFQSS
jgi:hypothetical protein